MKGHSTQHTRSVGGLLVANNASETFGPIVDVRGVDEIKAVLMAEAFGNAEISPAVDIYGGQESDGSDFAAIAGAAFDLIERDNDGLVTVVNLVNDTAFTLAADVPSPSRVVVVIVDTTPSITAGTIDVTGTRASDGAVVTESIDISAGAGTYVGSVVFSSVTQVIGRNIATLGGSGDETITVGHDNSGVEQVHQGRIEGQFAPAFVRMRKPTGGTGTSNLNGWFELSQTKTKAIAQRDGLVFDVDFVT